MQDYKCYLLNWKEKFACFGITIGLAGMIAWLFYHSIYVMASVVVLYIPVKKEVTKHQMRKRQSKMLFEFKEMLQMASAALKAGYSMENAFVQARDDFVNLYGEHTIMAQEFAYINHQVKLNVPLEKLLDDLAKRSGIEEINSFSQVFGFAKRSGGDFMRIFRSTVEKIQQKAEVKREIETVMAAKRMEMNIMNLVPFGILFYVGLTSPEFLEPLYGNLIGIGIMTFCLLGYGFVYLIAGKIVNVQV